MQLRVIDFRCVTWRELVCVARIVALRSAVHSGLLAHRTIRSHVAHRRLARTAPLYAPPTI